MRSKFRYLLGLFSACSFLLLPCCAQQRQKGNPFSSNLDNFSTVAQQYPSENLDSLVSDTLAIQTLGLNIRYSVLLPPSYFSQRKSYPLVLWLHGANGSSMSLHPLSMRFKRAMESGLMRESIVVFPESNKLSMWVNSNNNDYPIESALISHLLPVVNREYRVLAGRANSSIAGFSMGGYGAARIGLKYPHIFGSIVMIAAGTLGDSLSATPRADDVTRNSVFQKVYGNSTAYFYLQSPRYFAKKNLALLKKLGTKITIFVGSNDEVFDQNTMFHDYLEQVGIPSTFIVLPGVRHNLRDYVKSAHSSLFQALSF